MSKPFTVSRPSAALALAAARAAARVLARPLPAYSAGSADIAVSRRLNLCFARSGICLQRHIPVSRFLRPDTPALRVLIRPLTSLHAAEQHRTHERARSSNSFQFTAIA